MYGTILSVYLCEFAKKGGKNVSEKKSMLSSISYVMIIMLLSRVLALVSSSMYVSFFGTGDVYINIYSYAITIPNTIFNCFGTTLSTIVIPIYASHIANKNYDGAKRFADNVITVASVFTLLLVLCGMALSFVLPKFTAFDSGESYSFAVKSLMILMPVMLFYGLNYIFQGMLQSVGKYGMPAFVSAPGSILIILYVMFFADKYGVMGLVIVTAFGLSLQALLLIPSLIRSGYRYRPCFDLKDSDMRTALRMMVPVLLGASSYQINVFYNNSMAASFDGFVTVMTYVQNIVVYMVLAFVYSVTSVLYPKLTKAAAVGDMKGYKETLSQVLTNVWMLLLPISAGFIAVRYELLQLIIGWGKNDAESIGKAATVMLLYSFSVVSVGSKEIIDRAFYALKDTKLPAINGFIIMAANILLSLIFMPFMGGYGLPLAYSVSSLVGLGVLLVLLKKKIGSFGGGCGKNFVKCGVSAVVMYLAVTGLRAVLPVGFGLGEAIDRVLRLGILCMFGVVVYGILAVILRVPTVVQILDKVKCKFVRGGK